MSGIRVALFASAISRPEITHLRTILPAGPTEHMVDELPTSVITQRKLPPGIAPVEKIIQQSKSVEILSNSGLRNPALVNLMRVKLVFMFYPGIYIYNFIHKGCPYTWSNWSAHYSRSNYFR